MIKRKKVDYWITGDLPKLLKLIEHEEHPGRFKEAILGIIQLYFDGLVSADAVNNLNVWKGTI